MDLFMQIKKMELIKLPPDVSIAPSHNHVESIVHAVKTLLT